MLRIMLSATACLACGPALGHAFLDGAMPRVGSDNRTAPAEVVLHYTQGIEPDFSSIVVQDSTGASVTEGAAHTAPEDPTYFAVKVKPLGAGLYTVIWHVTSVDTHQTQGKFHFSVTQ